MGFKHTGLFPEQATNWDWFSEIIKNSKKDNVKVLNLFAYTGGATVAAAAAGASVCHVDAAKGMVAWAKENAALSGLADHPIRYIVDDVKKYTNLPIVMFNITDSCYCSNEKKLADLVNNLKEDQNQPTYINLICLGHNDATNRNVRSWNNLIYGEGNWVLYNKACFCNEWSNTIKKIASIIHKTIKIK
jgi:hypothetical protein